MIGVLALAHAPTRRRLVTLATVAVAVTGMGVSGMVMAGGSDGAAAASAPPCGSPDLGPVAEPPATSLAQVQPDPQRRAEAARNVGVIVAVGRQASVPPRGLVIAVAAALQESKLINLRGGDRDSLGLFQQRPSSGWGTPEQIMNPVLASRAFYGVAQHTHNAGLLDVPDWQLMPLTEAAQAVQRSGFPDAYAQWEPLATQLVQEAVPGADDAAAPLPVAGAPCPDAGGALAPWPGATAGERAVNAALSQLGVPYSWGGGGPDGPSRGRTGVGFDCSGLTTYAWWQAAHAGMPRTADGQWNAVQRVPLALASLQPGDLLFFGANGHADHVGIYDGAGGMIHAPRTGKNVERVPGLITFGSVKAPYWRDRFLGAGRLDLTQNAR